MTKTLLFLGVIALAITGCKEDPDEHDGTFWTPDDDWDGDGFGASNDCNDYDASVNPDGTEHCFNGLDDDCDGDVDCFDGTCTDKEICVPPEDCDNGVDDDEDGAIDCADGFCYYAEYCQDCRGGEAAYCGMFDSGSIGSGSETATDYLCGPPAPGREFVYEFVAPADGTLEVWIDPENNIGPLGGVDAALYIMEDACRADACIAHVNAAPTGDVETLQFQVVSGVHYFIAIERLNGGLTAGTGFDIEFRCL